MPARHGSDSLALDEVIAQYQGDWLLLLVTEFDDAHIPSHGRVIAHGSEKRVRKKLADLAAGPEKPIGPFYLFCAYPRVRSGAAWRAAVTAAAQGDRGARGFW